MKAFIEKLEQLEKIHQDVRSFRVDADPELRYQIQGIQRACLSRMPNSHQARPAIKMWTYYYELQGGLTFGRVSTLDNHNNWLYYWEVYLNNWFVVEVEDL